MKYASNRRQYLFAFSSYLLGRVVKRFMTHGLDVDLLGVLEHGSGFRLADLRAVR